MSLIVAPVARLPVVRRIGTTPVVIARAVDEVEECRSFDPYAKAAWGAFRRALGRDGETGRIIDILV